MCCREGEGWGAAPSLSHSCLAFCQKPLKSTKEAWYYGLPAPSESPGQVVMITCLLMLHINKQRTQLLSSTSRQQVNFFLTNYVNNEKSSGRERLGWQKERSCLFYIPYHNASCMLTICKSLTFENEGIVCWEELRFNLFERSIACIKMELTSWVKSGSAALGVVCVTTVWIWNSCDRCESQVYGQLVLLAMVLTAR